MSKKRPTLESVSSTDLVRVQRSPKYAAPLEGFIVAVGSKWALMHSVREGGYFDGYAAFRVSDVRRIRIVNSFAALFAATRPEWPPQIPPDVELGSTRGLLNTLALPVPLLGLRTERVRDALWMGVVRRFDRRWVELLEVDHMAQWRRLTRWFALKAVTLVFVRDGYSDALAHVTDFTILKGSTDPVPVGSRGKRIELDESVVAHLLHGDRTFSGSANSKKRDYSVSVVRVAENRVELQLMQGEREARLVVPTPSSTDLQPWIYMRIEDPAHWAEQLMVWLDEEMFTGGLLDSRARVDLDGTSSVVVQPYGFQRSDPDEHARLLEAAGPHGWYGRSPS